jgi:O-antigen ligase
MINAYANHAHNDVLEVWLEGGAVGLGLMVLFAIWLALRSVKVWRRAPCHGALEIDRSLARAAVLIIILLIVHSFVDYPLRTGAMMATIAFACALLIDPPVATENENGAEQLAIRRSETQSGTYPAAPPVSPALASSPTPPLQSTARPSKVPRRPLANPGGVNIEWPEAWRKSLTPRSPSANDKPTNPAKPRGD